jgi:hypothetical protein
MAAAELHRLTVTVQQRLLHGSGQDVEIPTRRIPVVQGADPTQLMGSLHHETYWSIRHTICQDYLNMSEADQVCCFTRRRHIPCCVWSQRGPRCTSDQSLPDQSKAHRVFTS